DRGEELPETEDELETTRPGGDRVAVRVEHRVVERDEGAGADLVVGTHGLGSFSLEKLGLVTPKSQPGGRRSRAPRAARSRSLPGSAACSWPGSVAGPRRAPLRTSGSAPA